MELLRLLSNAPGAPGREEEVRQVIRDHFKKTGLGPFQDHVGNLFYVKEGKPGKPRIMLDAHMDEIGLQVMWHTGGGDLIVRALGGIDDRVLAGKYVQVGKDKLMGVIGLKPPHTQERDEFDSVTQIKGLVVDIGAKDKAEAESKAPIGTVAVFHTEFEDWGAVVKGKSFDDRAGCWATCKAMETETDCTLIASFTFGEELGLKGSFFSARRFEPDLVVALEGTSASDVPEISEHQTCSKLYGGPVITFEDKSIIVPRKFRTLLENTATKHKIPWQYKGTVTGGTNAGRMQFEAGGIPCVVLAAPCRYIHSPVSIATKEDLENMVKLTRKYIERIDQEGLPE